MPKHLRSAFLLAFVLFLGCRSDAPQLKTPTSPTPSSGTVLKQGRLTIQQTGGADLDSGALNPSMSSADIWFQAVKPDERYVTPMNGARLVVMPSATAPGFDGCRSAGVAASSIPITSLTSGAYLCGSTKQAHVVEIRVDELPAPYVAGSASPTLVLTFTTFN